MSLTVTIIAKLSGVDTDDCAPGAAHGGAFDEPRARCRLREFTWRAAPGAMRWRQ